MKRVGAAKKPVLFVFARAVVPGQVKTRLCPPLSFRDAARLYESFLQDTLELCASIDGVDVRIAATDARDPTLGALAARYQFPIVEQRGSDLGERMSTVLSCALSEGAPAAAVLGTDTPTLPGTHLRRALRLLDCASVVLGPSWDGGYWLIGMRSPLPRLFSDLAWGTSTVLAETLSRLRELNVDHRCARLWYDVDTERDLARLRHHAQRFGARFSAQTLRRIDAGEAKS